MPCRGDAPHTQHKVSTHSPMYGTAGAGLWVCHSGEVIPPLGTLKAIPAALWLGLWVQGSDLLCCGGKYAPQDTCKSVPAAPEKWREQGVKPSLFPKPDGPCSGEEAGRITLCLPFLPRLFGETRAVGQSHWNPGLGKRAGMTSPPWLQAPGFRYQGCELWD